MKVTIENLPQDIVKIDTKSFPKGLQEEIKNTLEEPNEYGITWSEYLDVSDTSFLELLVSKINEAIEKDNKPKTKPKGKAKGKSKPTQQPIATTPQPKIEIVSKPFFKVGDYAINPKIRKGEIDEFLKVLEVTPNGEFTMQDNKKIIEFNYLFSSHSRSDSTFSTWDIDALQIRKSTEKQFLKAKAGLEEKTKPKSIYADFIKEINKIKPIKVTLTKAEQKVFDKNENENSHSENVAYLAKLSGNKSLQKAVNFSVKQRDKDESLSKENREFQEMILDQLKVTYFKETEKPKPAKPTSKPKPAKKTDAEKDKEAVAKKVNTIDLLEKDIKDLSKKVKANAKFKEKIADEVRSHLNKTGLAGKTEDIDAKIKMLKEKKKFWSNLLSGDKADFKAIGKRIGLSYRSSKPKK